jgi:hypothetical protein
VGLAGANGREERRLREALEERRPRRVEWRHFRRDPEGYLCHLEEILNQSGLPVTKKRDRPKGQKASASSGG